MRVGRRVDDRAAVDELMQGDGVARRRDHQDVGLVRRLDRVGQGLRDLVAADAHVHDVDAVVDRPLERGDDGAVLAVAARVHDLQGVELYPRRDTDDEVAVLVGGQDARDVRSVAVVIHRVGVVVDEVPASPVIAVELGVDRLGAAEVEMDVVDAAVDDRDLHALAPDAGVVHALRPDVAHAPGIVKLEVAGRGVVPEDADLPIGLDRLHAGVVPETFDCLDGHGRRDRGDDRVAEVDVAAGGVDRLLGGLARVRSERDDDLRQRSAGRRRVGRDRETGSRHRGRQRGRERRREDRSPDPSMPSHRALPRASRARTPIVGSGVGERPESFALLARRVGMRVIELAAALRAAGDLGAPCPPDRYARAPRRRRNAFSSSTATNAAVEATRTTRSSCAPRASVTKIGCRAGT